MTMRPENPALISNSVGEPNVGDSPPPKTPSSKRWTRFILPTYTTLFILYLIIPIVVMIVFAFNTPARKLYETLGYEVTGLNMQKTLHEDGGV